MQYSADYVALRLHHADLHRSDEELAHRRALAERESAAAEPDRRPAWLRFRRVRPALRLAPR